jgi:hypothetical protein
MFRSLLVAALAAAAALAQAPPADPPPGSIAGVVRNAVTRAPLEGVRVQAGGADSVTTNSLGQFAISEVEPGRQWVSASDDRRAASGGVYVLVSSKREASGVEIFLKLGGAISGKLLDENGNPVSGASILLLEPRFEFGELVYSARLTVSTGKDGAYRLEPVPAEQGFLILARNPLTALRPADEIAADPRRRPRVPVPTYYPSSRLGREAETVRLAPGEMRQDAGIRMGSAPPYCIGGKLDAPEDAALSAVMIDEARSLALGVKFKPATAMTAAEGRFRACGIPPGEYQLSAVDASGQHAPFVYAFAPVSIVDRDLHDVRLEARAPAPIPGAVSWEPPPRDKSADPRALVMLIRYIADGNYADDPKSPSPQAVMVGMGDRVQVPGPFKLDGVPPDDYRLDVSDLPPGCYVKEASYGGADVRSGIVRLTKVEGPLRLGLACDGGFLTARVSDRDGNPVSQAHLCLMPADAASEAALSKDIQCADVDKGWSSITQPLAPGKYLAIASEVNFDGAAQPLIKLWRARSKAKPVEIGPNATVQLTLELVEVN